MRTDIRDTLRDAASRPRTEPDMAQLLRRSKRLRRRRRLAATAAVLGLALGGSGFAVAALREPSRPITVAAGGQGAGSVVEVPAAGDVRTDVLDDGTPVFVLHETGGAIRVLSAIDPHGSFGVHDLVWWCPTSRRFEEPRSGSTFDSRGRRSGGPAPSGLVTYRYERIASGARIRVGSPKAPVAVTGSEAAAGATCVDGITNLPAGTVVRHEFPTGDERALTPRDALRRAQGDLVLIEGSIVVTDDSVRLCEQYSARRCVNGASLRVSPSSGVAGTLMTTGVFLARANSDQLADVILVEVSSETLLTPTGDQSVTGEYPGFIGPETAVVEVRDRPSLTFQARDFVTNEGIVRLDFVTEGGSHALAIDDPRLDGFVLTVDGDHPRSSGKVYLEPGTYTILCDIPGHRAAGEEATLTVRPRT